MSCCRFWSKTQRQGEWTNCRQIFLLHIAPVNYLWLPKSAWDELWVKQHVAWSWIFGRWEPETFLLTFTLILSHNPYNLFYPYVHPFNGAAHPGPAFKCHLEPPQILSKGTQCRVQPPRQCSTGLCLCSSEYFQSLGFFFSLTSCRAGDFTWGRHGSKKSW